VRPLPRLLAFGDDRVAALDDLGVRASAIAAAGPGVALVARLPAGSIDALASLARRFVALALPPMASVMVTGRVDVAGAVGANGVILRKEDLAPGIAREILARRHDRSDAAHFILRSVHSESEAEAAVRGGADALVVGTIWPSATHAGTAAGTGLLERVVSFGVPTYAIGGVTPALAIEARAAGAWGVAAISALWNAAAPYRVALDLLKPWVESA
jgi:thiamine-phosphate pyrophosphorylase